MVIIVKLMIVLSIIANLGGAHPAESVQNVCPDPICEDKNK